MNDVKVNNATMCLSYCLDCWEECTLCACQDSYKPDVVDYFLGEGLDSERPDPVPCPFESDEPVKTKKKRKVKL